MFAVTVLVSLSGLDLDQSMDGFHFVALKNKTLIKFDQHYKMKTFYIALSLIEHFASVGQNRSCFT